MYILGHYLERSSPVHRLDPRVKMLAIFVLGPVILAAEPLALGAAAALAVFLCCLCRIYPWTLLMASRPLWPFFALMFLVYSFLSPGDSILPWDFPLVSLSREGLILGAIQVSRFLILMLAAALLTTTTPLSALTAGLEWILRPLQAMGISSDDLAMMICMAIRFIPAIQEEARTMSDARLARGASYDGGSLSARVWFLAELGGALIASTLRRSDDLVAAIEARAYQNGPRSHMHDLSASIMDVLVALVTVITAAAFWIGL